MVAANIAVAAPVTAITVIAMGDSAKMKLSRATRYTPAVTMVAAWMSADTGVGPAMASGSQTCSGACADLPHAANKNNSATTSGIGAPKIALAANDAAKV